MTAQRPRGHARPRGDSEDVPEGLGETESVYLPPERRRALLDAGEWVRLGAMDVRLDPPAA